MFQVAISRLSPAVLDATASQGVQPLEVVQHRLGAVDRE
jgi:hypothetical protein